MVSAYLVDALKDPTSELEELYARTSSSVDFPSEVARHFSTVFSADHAFSEVSSYYIPAKLHSLKLRYPS